MSMVLGESLFDTVVGETDGSRVVNQDVGVARLWEWPILVMCVVKWCSAFSVLWKRAQNFGFARRGDDHSHDGRYVEDCAIENVMR